MNSHNSGYCLRVEALGTAVTSHPEKKTLETLGRPTLRKSTPAWGCHMGCVKMGYTLAIVGIQLENDG